MPRLLPHAASGTHGQTAIGSVAFSCRNDHHQPDAGSRHSVTSKSIVDQVHAACPKNTVVVVALAATSLTLTLALA